MIKRLVAAWKAAKKKLRNLIRKRHHAPAHSKERQEYAAGVKQARLAVQRDAAAVKAARKPDFNGCPQNVSDAIRKMIVRANRNGLYVTATTNGTHASTSYHYSGRAVDVAAPMTAAGIKLMSDFQLKLVKDPGKYVELFGPVNNACVKNGVRITLAEGTSLENQHDNHVHIAI